MPISKSHSLRHISKAARDEIVDDGTSGLDFGMLRSMMGKAPVRADVVAFSVGEAGTVAIPERAPVAIARPSEPHAVEVEPPPGDFSADLPIGADQVALWDQADGTILLSWRITDATGTRNFVRRVDASGATVGDEEQIELHAPQGLSPDINVRLIGIDTAGVAALSWYPGTRDDPTHILWIEATSGSVVRDLVLPNSYSEATRTRYNDIFHKIDIYVAHSEQVGYFPEAFEDGYVLVSKNFYTADYADSSRTETVQTEYLLIASDADDDVTIASAASWKNRISTFSGEYYAGYASRSVTNVSANIIFELGWNEQGDALYLTDSLTYMNFESSIGQGGSSEDRYGSASDRNLQIVLTDGTAQTVDIPIDREVNSEQFTTPYQYQVIDTEILEDGNYAVSYFNETGDPNDGFALTVFFYEGQRSTILGKAAVTIQALGSDRYLLGFSDGTAQIHDERGDTVGALLSYRSGTRFLVRGDGTFVSYFVEDDGVQGQSTQRPEVAIRAATGDFIDRDGDGDLDYSGIVFIGLEGGEAESLRLEGGGYELTDDELKVTGATVFANIGDDTGSAIFKGTFTVDRATGEVKEVKDDPLDDDNRFNIAGLVPKVSAFSLKAEGAAFSIGLTLPDTFFGATEIKLESPNSLLLTSAGARLSGGELELGDFGDRELDFFGLFAVESKDIKVKYDAAEDEMSFEGELSLKSPLIDGLLGTEDISLTLKELKLKEGKFSLTTELTAAEWGLGPITLSDIKLGIEIEDDAVKQVEGEFKIELPFAQLGGVGFAGSFLLLPAETEGQRLFLDKIGIELDVTVALPEGFFLDSIAGSIDHFAPFPPEEEDTPTEFEGKIGLGWGPKLPDIDPIEELGFEGIEDARIVNIELTAKTDWTTSISAAGKINLITDQLAKFEGAVEWDFEKNNVSFTGSYDYFSGTSKGTASLKISELGVTGLGTGTFTIPDFALFGPVAGLSLSGSTMIQALADGDATNDFVAQWAVVTLPLFGGASIVQTVGFRIDLNTAALSLILGSDDVPEGGAPPEEDEGASARMAAAAADASVFAAKGGEDWLMLSAVWETAATGAVATQLRAPDGRIIAEADYGANGITVIDLYSGPRGRTIVIDDPTAGDWSFGLVDENGLGAVTYRGYSPNPGVTVVLDEAALAAGAPNGTVSATVAGADVGTIVSFWADTDGAGFDGFALGSVTLDAAAVAAGRVTHMFDAAVLNGGSYHVYAIADDRHGAPSLDYGAGTIAVAHAANDIAIDTAAVTQGALPGTVLGTLSAANVDETETHVFSLGDDAGGRFTIVDGKLVVGTGAPFDAATQDVTIIATTSRGLTYSETLTVTVAMSADLGLVGAGTGGIDNFVGSARDDLFYGVAGGDVVIGQGGSDLLYIDGNRADFSITIDTTGEIAGPVRLNPLTPELIAAGLVDVASPFDPAPPYLIIRDLRGDGPPIVASRIALIQFRDERIDVSIPVGAGGIYAPVAGDDAYEMTTALAPSLIVTAAQGVLPGDIDLDTPGLVASVVTGPTNGTLLLGMDGGFSYTPNAGFIGLDSFVYRAFDGANHSDATVTLLIGNGLTLSDATGSEVLIGSAGNDLLTDTNGDVAIDARSGDDRVVIGYSFDRKGTIAGGDGIDTLRGSGDLNLFAVSGFEVLETVGNTATLTAAQIAAFTTIRTGADSTGVSLRLADAGTINVARKLDPDVTLQLDGSDGNDVLVGSVLDDSIRGRAGDDILRGGLGDDSLVGDAGSDTAVFAGRYVDHVLERNLFGFLYVSGAEGRDLVHDIEILRFADGSYYVASETFTATTTAGDDVIVGDATDDILLGAEGNDRLEGGDGNDRLNGGTGADVMIGGAGSDRYVIDDAGDVVVEIDAPGRDTVRSFLSYTLGDFVENLTLVGGAPIDGIGNAMRNVLIGNRAANELSGGAGPDRIEGGAGNDVLRGQGGDDTLVGGLGRDVLIGGAGADRFVFDTLLDAASNRDLIADFVLSEDVIVLDTAIFVGLAPGVLPAAAFARGLRAIDARPTILYDEESGLLAYDPDGVGELAAITFARLDPGLALTAEQFLLV